MSRARVRGTVEPQPAAPQTKLQTLSQMIDNAANRPRQPWTSETIEPDSGVDYTQVLAGPAQRPANTVAGLSAIALGYLIIYPGVAGIIVGLGWLVRGRPGTYGSFSVSALSFGYLEGMAAGFAALAVFVLIAQFMVRMVHRRRVAWLSSVQPGLRWRYLVVVAVVATVVLNAVYWVTSGRTDFVWNPQANAWVWLVIIVLLAPLQAAGEEYLFRGYLMQVLGTFVRQKWLVVLVSAVVFTLIHGTQNLPLMLDRFAFGALMGALVVLTGGLEASVAAHAVNNVFAFGYASLSGGVANARALTEVSWATAGSNIAAYAVIGVIAWLVGRAMKVATRTP